MIDVAPHRQALTDRIAVVDALLDETHRPSPASNPIARETRGIAVVLLFAAYEELLTSLTRTLLETAAGLKVGNRRLQPGFRAFALHNVAKSLNDSSSRKLYLKAIPAIVEAAGLSDQTTIDTDAFPTDGSFMKRSQIELWARLFNTGSPARLLQSIWPRIDTIVTQRNQVAHGGATPQTVGRSYTEAEIRALVSDWATDWDNFLVEVGRLASSRDFFRMPR